MPSPRSRTPTRAFDDGRTDAASRALRRLRAPRRTRAACASPTCCASPPTRGGRSSTATAPPRADRSTSSRGREPGGRPRSRRRPGDRRRTARVLRGGAGERREGDGRARVTRSRCCAGRTAMAPPPDARVERRAFLAHRRPRTMPRRHERPRRHEPPRLAIRRVAASAASADERDAFGLPIDRPARGATAGAAPRTRVSDLGPVPAPVSGVVEEEASVTDASSRIDPRALAAVCGLDDLPRFFEDALARPLEDADVYDTAALVWCLARPALRDVALVQWSGNLAAGRRGVRRAAALGGRRGVSGAPRDAHVGRGRSAAGPTDSRRRSRWRGMPPPSRHGRRSRAPWRCARGCRGRSDARPTPPRTPSARARSSPSTGCRRSCCRSWAPATCPTGRSAARGAAAT